MSDRAAILAVNLKFSNNQINYPMLNNVNSLILVNIEFNVVNAFILKTEHLSSLKLAVFFILTLKITMVIK